MTKITVNRIMKKSPVQFDSETTDTIDVSGMSVEDVFEMVRSKIEGGTVIVVSDDKGLNLIVDHRKFFGSIRG